MANRLLIGGMAVALGLSGNACRSEAPSEEPPPAAASTESHDGHQTAKVYFKEPMDGATVSSKTPVKFVFGADNYQISAVPAEVKEVRPNVGHFHLGVNTDCLPAGTEIPKADPNAPAGTAGSWIHFGKGTDNIEMALAPGDYRFAVEVGDDLHRAVEGLCQTINIKVE